MQGLAAHHLEVDDVLTALEVDPQHGLDRAEVERRRDRFGSNELETKSGPTSLQLFGRQFTDPMVWLLLIAAAVSGGLLGEWIDAGVIAAIVLLNAGIGYRQESRAEEALAALKQMAAPEAIVLREGSEARIAAAELVPGDIVVLEAGDRVPADARLVVARHLETDESPLTGESLPVGKRVEPVAEASRTGDRSSMVFAGTSVTRGRAVAAVSATGMATAVGEIALLLEQDEPPTPLEVELARVGRRIGLLVVGIAIVMFGVGVLRSFPPEAMFLTAVALAVAAIPEGLPAVVTITLARGVQRMAAARAIVRKLTAVEALGSASVICTDKTGTLTRNEMVVQKVAFVDGVVDDTTVLPRNDRSRRFVQVAALCNDARPGGQAYLGDPTEVAIAMAAAAHLDVEETREQYERLDEAAFDSSRKRMSTLHATADGRLVLAVKGAPEVLIPLCDREERADGVAPIEEASRLRINQSVEEFAAGGLRALALAYREVDVAPEDLADVETSLIFLGVMAMSDEVRPEAYGAVREAEEAGIRVVMVTGDHEVTARAVGEELGIGGEVMSGSTLSGIEVEDLDAERYGVYARVDPADKVKLVKAWQSRGAVVAMTGDGVNDAPALNIADIGVAMGSGTDVAKDASSMVLSDDNFATIIGAVREGRVIYSNLRKVVGFLLSANISEVIVMLVGFLLLGGRGEPLLATQLLWVNLVTDGLPALGLGVDAAAPGLMRQAPTRSESMLSARRQLTLLWQGSFLAVAVLGVYGWGVVVTDAPWETIRTMGFSTLVLTQMLHVWNVRAEGSTAFRVGIGGNRLLVGGVIGSLVLQVLVVHTSIGQRLFETVPLRAGEWATVVVAGVLSFLAVHTVKTISIHRDSPRSDAR